MTQNDVASVAVPKWTVGDRLRKAREAAGLSQDELATEIGISRRTVSTYEGMDKAPRRPVLSSWALRTGVPTVWITTGDLPEPTGGLPRLDSNQEPAGYRWLTLPRAA